MYNVYIYLNLMFCKKDRFAFCKDINVRKNIFVKLRSQRLFQTYSRSDFEFLINCCLILSLQFVTYTNQNATYVIISYHKIIIH